MTPKLADRLKYNAMTLAALAKTNDTSTRRFCRAPGTAGGRRESGRLKGPMIDPPAPS